MMWKREMLLLLKPGKLVAFLFLTHYLLASRSQLTAEANNKNQFNAQCFLNRDPNLNSLPTIRVHSPDLHQAGTQACEDSSGVVFELREPDDWEEQRQAIGEELLSSKNNNPYYNPQLPTYVLIHGFLADWKSNDWMCNVKNQILNSIPANVLILDWSGGAKPLLPMDYGMAVSNTQLVADILSVFLDTLFDLTAPPNNATTDLHLIGHSLGAHIAGFVGYSLNGSVRQIVALDPAGPCFTTRPNMDDRSSASSGFLEPGKATRRLSRASAVSVTAIHTDTTLFGLNENCADIDVYVNGGERQPGSDTMLDLTYSHSFAHDILNTYTSKSPSYLCYPIAYLCSSMRDYEAGQCGVCPDNDDDRCALMAIELNSASTRRKQVMPPRSSSNRLNETRRMHIKLPGEPNSCFFTYQVVLAFNQQVGSGLTFYLEINQSGRQRRGQFFRISNGVEIKSEAHKRLVAEQAAWQNQNKTTYSSSSSGKKPLPVARQFYTALLSFQAEQGCRLSDVNNNNTNNKSDCVPLDGLTDSRVWAEDDSSQLASLSSVTINYMSARNHSERMKYSYMILSDSKQGYVSGRGKDVAAASLQATTTTTTRKPLNVVRAFRSMAEKPIKCLTGIQCPQVDPAQEFERFKYFVRLRPTA